MFFSTTCSTQPVQTGVPHYNSFHISTLRLCTTFFVTTRKARAGLESIWKLGYEYFISTRLAEHRRRIRNGKRIKTPKRYIRRFLGKVDGLTFLFCPSKNVYTFFSFTYLLLCWESVLRHTFNIICFLFSLPFHHTFPNS